MNPRQMVRLTPKERFDRRDARLKKLKPELLSLVDSVPARYQEIMIKAWCGELGPTPSVKAKCYECVGFEDITNNVHKCTVERCPLWRHRPKGKKKV